MWIVVFLGPAVLIGALVYWPVYRFDSPLRHLLTYPPLPATATALEWAFRPSAGWDWPSFLVWFVVFLPYYAAFIAMPANRRRQREAGLPSLDPWGDE